MMAVPVDAPVTTPVLAPTPAIPEALLTQTPPVGLPENVMVAPLQTADEPEIVGVVLTVTTAVAVQAPAGIVYVIVDVPGEIPVTIPVDPIPAIPLLLLLQCPPDVASDNAVVDPAHTLSVPVMEDGGEKR